MPVNKLQRFAEIEAMSHVLEYTDFQDEEVQKPKSRWHSEIFGNENPITLELGCGKGAYTTALAELHPDRNYIGIDIKGARLWKGAKRAEEMKLENVRFLRIYIEHLAAYFARNEAAEIWITFPDPFPRRGDRNKRLTSPRFLEMYEQIVAPGGMIHLKTDDSAFFNYSLQAVQSCGGTIVKQYDDIYGLCPDACIPNIKTAFEKKHLAKGKTIKYLEFTLAENLQ